MKYVVIVGALLSGGAAFYLKDTKIGFGCLIVAALLIDAKDVLAAIKEAAGWRKAE